MIVELIQCDECKNTHDARNPIPAYWIQISQTGQLILHFCSDLCLLHHINSRAHLDLKKMLVPEQPQAPQSATRRFTLTDGETADEFEGALFSSGHVVISIDPELAPVTVRSWKHFKETHEGCDVTWIDQEVSDAS